MTTLLQCHNISYSAGTKTLFEDLDLNISSGDRIGLVGHNGSGKSTLLKLISKQLEVDKGEISRNSDMHLATVEQFIEQDLLDLTLFDALAIKLPVEERDYSAYKAARLLESLGFTEAEFTHTVHDLSGGQQNRLMFARAVINEPDLILFDEPTNHLDLSTLVTFENFLGEMQAAYLLVSHDRQFLDSVTDRTLFLRDQKIYSFNQSYTEARFRLDEMDQSAEEARRNEERKIRSLAASAKRLALWGKVYDNEKFARKAKSMQKRVERMEAEKTFVSRGSGLSLELDVSQSKANRLLHVENQDILAPGNSKTLFHINELYIRPGDRVALLGVNGVGKTTLIQRLIEEYNATQESLLFKFNPQVDIGYYDQELELLAPNLTMMQCLIEHCPGSERDFKSSLIRAGIPYRDIDKPVRVLSGGEKARLMFLIIRLNKPNFLILDEPTNHIDIQGKEELESQILESGATVLLTSHDRRFVDVIADRFLLVSHGKLVEINDPDDFYRQESVSGPTASSRPDAERSVPGDQEAILERIVELETLLAEDMARKPRFQKPERQQTWQEEIAELTARLS